MDVTPRFLIVSFKSLRNFLDLLLYLRHPLLPRYALVNTPLRNLFCVAKDEPLILVGTLASLISSRLVGNP